MKDDVKPETTPGENLLTEAMNVQIARVLDVLEMAMLQAMNDIRGAFEDLSEKEEAGLEAHLYEEVVSIAMVQILSLESPLRTKPALKTSDPQIKQGIQELRNRLNALES